MKAHLLGSTMLAATVLLGAQGAQACDGFGYGWGLGNLYNSLDYNAPHFAAHPPVYYSYPVPRTYGYSPFAYPPGVMTPEVAMGPEEPVEIINPYVPSSAQEDAPSGTEQDQTASRAQQPQPLVIYNPFVGERAMVARTD